MGRRLLKVTSRNSHSPGRTYRQIFVSNDWKTTVTLSAKCFNFFLKIWNSNCFSFVVIHPKNLLFSLKEENLFWRYSNRNAKMLQFSFLNLRMISAKLVFSYIWSVIWLEILFKKREKNSRHVLENKLSSKKKAIFTGEYLQNNN